MRIYVSQSEVGKSDKEYIKERKEIIKQIKAEYGDDVEIIGSYVKDKWGSTDKAFFAPGWKDDEACITEHDECERFGIEIIYDGLPEKTNREKLLEEAKRIVCGDRDRQYGKPEFSAYEATFEPGDSGIKKVVVLQDNKHNQEFILVPGYGMAFRWQDGKSIGE